MWMILKSHLALAARDAHGMAGLRDDFSRFDQRLTAVEQRQGGLEGTMSKVIDVRPVY
jgi:hypothetical protein